MRQTSTLFFFFISELYITVNYDRVSNHDDVHSNLFNLIKLMHLIPK